MHKKRWSNEANLAEGEFRAEHLHLIEQSCILKLGLIMSNFQIRQNRRRENLQKHKLQNHNSKKVEPRRTDTRKGLRPKLQGQALLRLW